jgi:hypothetical protein
MKIQPEHYTIMHDAIAALPRDAVAAHKAGLVNDPRVKDLGKRFRWDLLNAAHLIPFVCDTIYSYANDTHIDTALRAIVTELEI